MSRSKIEFDTGGYIRLVTWTPWNMGETLDEENLVVLEDFDLIPVNAARASFLKESEELTEKDKKLLSYLARNNETSPFRHASLGFEIKAPLMVARQWWKYVVGSNHTDPMSSEGFDWAWNESSRRYLTEAIEFFRPKVWRKAPENKKQGSEGYFDLESLESRVLFEMLEIICKMGEDYYNRAISMGVAPELARLFLPAYGLLLTWRWTPSLAAVAHFINERTGPTAQEEITQYALAAYDLTKLVYPESIKVLVDDKRRE